MTKEKCFSSTGILTEFLICDFIQISSRDELFLSEKIYYKLLSVVMIFNLISNIYVLNCSVFIYLLKNICFDM